MAERKKNVTAKDIRASLLKQLKAKGADMPHYENLIDQYVDFFEIAKKLKADIKKRGVTYKDFSSVGVPIEKNNPSVKELQGVSRQMLSILKELQLTTDKVVNEDDEEL